MVKFYEKVRRSKNEDACMEKCFHASGLKLRKCKYTSSYKTFSCIPLERKNQKISLENRIRRKVYKSMSFECSLRLCQLRKLNDKQWEFYHTKFVMCVLIGTSVGCCKWVKQDAFLSCSETIFQIKIRKQQIIKINLVDKIRNRKDFFFVDDERE